MKERIFGIETEYALTCCSPTTLRISDIDDENLLKQMQSLTRKLLTQLDRSGYTACGEFLLNGGRLYMDRGGHPEYATPECRSVVDLITYERAGDQIIQELFLQVFNHRRDSSSSFHLLKNNVDFYGNTYGCHENYLITEEAYKKIEAIVPFLITRQIYTGAGKVLYHSDSDELEFRISQRADYFDRVYSDRTSKVRGIINTRHREIIRQGMPRRLHLILADSNMCELAMALKIGTTHLVLRLLEEDTLGELPYLSTPIEALKQVSRNPFAPLKLEGKQAYWTALEIQNEYLEKIYRFSISHSISQEEKWIQTVWEKVLYGLKHIKLAKHKNYRLEEDPENLHQQLDWVLKLWLMGRYSSSGSTSRKRVLSQKLDFLYHDLNTRTGLYERCRKLGFIKKIVDDYAVNNAKTTSPANTRARLRNSIIQNAAKKDIAVFVDSWNKIRLQMRRRRAKMSKRFDWVWSKANQLVISMEDPFESESKEVEKALDEFFGNWD